MKNIYEPIEFVWMEPERRNEGYITEYPSLFHESTEIAYRLGDVIEIYAVVDHEGLLYLKLFSPKHVRFDYIQLSNQDSTSPEYGAELQDEEFVLRFCRAFDAELHDIFSSTEN